MARLSSATLPAGERSRGGGSSGKRKSASVLGAKGGQGVRGCPGQDLGRTSTERIRERPDPCCRTRRVCVPVSLSSGTPRNCHSDTSSQLGAVSEPREVT